MDDAKRAIPKKLWMFWHQGAAEAPFVVKKCIESWVKENPGWDICVLDRNNLQDFIKPDLPEDKLDHLALNKQANLFRLQLLADHGGVWTDATTICMRPLDEWIDHCAASGFFAFHRPNKDRLLSNWFIASEKGCPLVERWRKEYVSFFMDVDYDVDRWYKRRMIKILKKFFNRSDKTTRYWLSPFVSKGLRVYPYFICHYIFERVVSSDPECRRIWQNTKKVSAAFAPRIKRYGLFAPPDEKIKKEIDEKRTPLYKLTWKYDHSRYNSDSVLYYLLEGRHSS